MNTLTKLAIQYVSVVFFAMLCVAHSVAAQAPTCAGWIDAIEGHAYWKSSVNAKPVLLDPRRDKYRRLYAGNYMKVDPGGALQLSLYGRVTNLKGRSNWYPVPFVHTPAQDAQMQVLNNYTRIGGRERTGSFIYSPASESAVHPEDLIVCWVAQEFRGALTVTLQNNDGNDLWQQSGVRASVGSLDSEALRRAMQKYRAGGNQRQLILAIADPDGNSAQSSFTLLSDQDSHALAQDLTRWDHETGLLRHLGRVEAFATRGMTGDVAREYDLALAEAPDSQDLLRAAIAAQERVGNTVRVRELTQLLASGGASLQRKKVQPPQ